MSLNSIMLLGKTSPRIWLIFTSMILMAVLSETRRNWGDDKNSEVNQDRKSKERGETSDSNSDAGSDKKEISKEKHEKADLSDKSDSDEVYDADNLHSTRGLKAEDFEPEDIKNETCPGSWLTDEMRTAMRRRDQAFLKFRRDRCEDKWNRYKAARNRCHQKLVEGTLRILKHLTTKAMVGKRRSRSIKH